MPKSKRDKKVSLTKVPKKGLELKQHIIEDIRACVEKYTHIVLFSVDNMRNNKLKDIRVMWAGSRFFFGKNKIIALALGKTAEGEITDGISKLAANLSGQCGLFFTNEPTKKILKWMKEFGETDYARSGFIVSKTIELPAGPLLEFAHSIEPHLRLLGMPTALQKGVVTLLKDFIVCKKGQTLTPEQARILKLIRKPLAKFRFVPIGTFTKNKGYASVSKNNKVKENGEKSKGKEETENDENQMEE